MSDTRRHSRLGSRSGLVAVLLAAISACCSAAKSQEVTGGQGLQAETLVAYPDSLLDASAGFEVEAAVLLGAPSDASVLFSEATYATYGAFDTRVAYDTEDLAALLGVAVETLAEVDFVALDLNSGGGGFGDSEWRFYDGTNVLSHTHAFSDGPNGPVLANNEQLDVGALANSLFGTSFLPTRDFGVIAFDLSSHGINPASPNFQVTLQGGGLACANDCPDVAVMGIVEAVPAVPSMNPMVLYALAPGLLVGAGLLALRRRG